MSERQVRVTFHPHGRRVYVLEGTTVLEAAGRAGLTIETPCGGSATCGKCRIQVLQEPTEPTEADAEIFSDEQLQEGWRLGCRTVIRRDTTIHVPESSLLSEQHQILTEGIAPTEHTLPDSREYSGSQRDITDQRYGVAFDVGTTTVVGAMLDLASGEEVAISARLNPQVTYGDDVLSRIQYAGEDMQNLTQLHKIITTAVSEMISEMCSQANVKREQIYELVFTGNTTMQHLLCALPVAQLGQVPFTPARYRGLTLDPSELGIPCHPRARAHVFPVIGGFVGGDTVGCMLGTRLTQQEGPVLLVDIGTNGEIVLSCDGKVTAASTAAGPAFEGARISCGVRASSGAIEKIVFDGDVRFSVIGGGAPKGICGSALVDLGAELLECGLLLSNGRLLKPDEVPRNVPGCIRKRVLLDGDRQPQFLICDEGNTHDGWITLTQRDVRQLQLAAGAIRVGISILLKQAGVRSADLQQVYLAGGFGSFIRRSNAQRIGLLPGDVDHSRIHYVGNASLIGARWALLSTDARDHAEQLAQDTEHVQLSRDDDFQTEFANAMIFPKA